MVDINEKAKDVIKKAMKTDFVVIEKLGFRCPYIREPIALVDVRAVVGHECRQMDFDMVWDGEVNDFRSLGKN